MKYHLKHIASFLLILTLILPLIGCQSIKADQRFEALCQEFFLDEMSSNELTLHYCLSNPEQYDICTTSAFLPLNPKARKERHNKNSSLLQDLRSIKPKALSTKKQLDYEALMFSLDLSEELYTYELFEEPLSPNNGIQAQLPILLAEFSLNNKSDVDSYINLLIHTDSYFDEILAFEKEKVNAGLFMSDENCVLVLKGCEDFLENRKNNFLFSTFEKRLDNIPNLSAEEKNDYINKNQNAITEHVFPAYENMIHTLTKLLGSGKNNLGLCNLPNGKEYYSLLTAQNTGCRLSDDELFELIETKRKEDLLVYSNLLSNDPSLTNQSETISLTQTDASSMIEAVLTAMSDDFPAPVTAQYQLSDVDSCLCPYLAPAFYITAPYDDPLQNRIYLNPVKTDTGISQFTTLAHEGFPGHLYQTTMSYHYGLSPARFCLDFPGYTEGWATYVEMLSYQYADLTPALANMLSLNQTIMLSLYASSDIGIHYLGWGLPEMTDFWSTYGISDENVIKEITRLILSEPGSYLKYYVGYLQFEQLKIHMQEELGDSFSLYAFHEALLRMGPAPFFALEEYFDDYYTLHKKAS